MTRRIRKWTALVAFVSAGTVFQFLPNSCAQLSLYQGLAAFNVCSVLNCGSGTFFNFCAPNIIFLDCPTPANNP